VTAKKILHMHFGKEGGAERFFVNLVTAFAERGAEQRFVIRPDRLWHDEVAALGPVIENHYRRLLPSTLLLTWRVHRMIQAWRPDVIMAWIPRASRLIPDFAGAVKITRLGDNPRNLKHFRHVDCLVAIAPEIADRCRSLGWRGPLQIIPNFARQILPVPVDRSKLATPRDAFVISGSGRFVPRKGFDTLIRAASKVPGAWLWLMGDGEERPKLERLVAEVGMADRTRFTGWVKESIHYVAASDVFGMPSRHEPLGNVIFECWQAGVPMVSTRSEGPSWVMTDGQDALLCDIDDVGGMASALDRIRLDAPLGRRLVANGRAKLAAEYSPDRIVSRYFDLFERKF
jgi:glycosyltransferase involved in cell wall biosynthesis